MGGFTTLPLAKLVPNGFVVPMIASFDVFALPDTDADEILTLLKRCDKFVCHGDAPPLCELRFDVLADILAELLQIGGGFEWSKSKYSSTPA